MNQGNIFDIIFVGGGAAGCVAAGRLTSANPDLKILILEAGPHSLDVESQVQPVFYLLNARDPQKGIKSFAIHVSPPSEAVANRPLPILTGQVVGGGSAVNFMVYTRASASDYDDWEIIHKNPGWGSKDLIPLLKGIENYRYDISNETHGKEGAIRVSFPKDPAGVSTDFLQAAREYDKERPVTNDWNDFKTSNGYGVWLKHINDETGRRSDTAHAFIYSQLENKNLTVLSEKRVIRILFEGTRAIGVEYVSQPNQASPISAFASKLVVLSAGTFGSAPVLERSGIGSEEILRQNGISTLVDLPGVGDNYQDHQQTLSRYIASKEADTVDHIFLHASEEKLRGILSKAMIPTNGLDAGYKFRPSVDEVRKLGPAFEEYWNEVFAEAPDKPLVFGGHSGFYVGPDAVDPQGKHFGLTTILAYPRSTGTIHITHGLDPYAPLDVRHNYLEDEADVVAHRWSYKHLRELARRTSSYAGELQHSHPVFPAGSSVACKSEDTPTSIDAPKLVYTAEDDEAIDRFHRQTVGTAWHSLGTCAMKPRDEGGVVNSRLNVYGTTQLKVLDMSICPGNVGANTYNTALGIGAKGAVLIAEDLGLKL